MRITKFSIPCALLLPVFLGAQQDFGADLSRLVVVGDSLSAGMQNFSLLDMDQPHGYASIIARQANVPLVLPLVPAPGAPNVLTLESLSPLTIAPVPGNLPAIPRQNPCEQPTNIAVPGLTVGRALTDVPAAQTASLAQDLVNIVLGFPSPFGAATGCTSITGQALTEIQQAIALKPTTVIAWLGNDDALLSAQVGTVSGVTPLGDFAASYEAVLDELGQTGATIITANLPDLTEIPYFTPVAALAAQTGLPLAFVTSELQVSPQDYLLPTAVPLATTILTGQKPGPLPQICPTPPANLGSSGVPCVFAAQSAEQLRSTIDEYNVIISAESLAHGAVMVDIHGLVDDIYQHGYDINGHYLTTNFLGGLFSLDGIHPTNTGYGVIANAFIANMNGSLGTNIPLADLTAIIATDPLIPPIKLPGTPSWPSR
jgi:hypothetical protein